MTKLIRAVPFTFQRSDILEFYRRVSFSFRDQLANSMAELSRAKKETVLPAYLSSLQDMVDIIKKLLSRAVAVVSVLLSMVFFSHVPLRKSFKSCLKSSSDKASLAFCYLPGKFSTPAIISRILKLWLWFFEGNFKNSKKSQKQTQNKL